MSICCNIIIQHYSFPHSYAGVTLLDEDLKPYRASFGVVTSGIESVTSAYKAEAIAMSFQDKDNY